MRSAFDALGIENAVFLTPFARLIDAFVDDTSLAITDTHNPMTPNAMIQSIEKIAQNWERILFLS